MLIAISCPKMYVLDVQILDESCMRYLCRAVIFRYYPRPELRHDV